MAKYPAVVWTHEMDVLLRAAYQASERGGVRKLAEQLGIAVSSVTHRAKQLGVIPPATARTRVAWTPDMDAEITRVYRAGKLGGNKAVAYKLGLAPGLISARAAKLGLPPLAPNGRRPDSWTEREKALVRAHLGEPLAQIRARLYRAGCSRSLHAIKHLISKQRALGNWPTLDDQVANRDQWLLPEVARGLGVKNQQIDYWVIHYGLRATRYGGRGDRAIAIADLRDWLREHAGQWDHRKADPFFLIDVLTYTRRGQGAFSKQEAA